jgi:hypothetical protein
VQVYLDGANKRVQNTATLDAMNIKHDHKELAKFTPMDCDTWDDDDYTVDVLHRWGQPDTPGYLQMRTLVENWIQNIKLGAVARTVLTEYIDSHLHCFDNKQNYHPSTREKDADQTKRTDLASWQTQELSGLQEKHLTCMRTSDPTHRHSNKCRQPLEGKSPEQVIEACTCSWRGERKKTQSLMNHHSLPPQRCVEKAAAGEKHRVGAHEDAHKRESHLGHEHEYNADRKVAEKVYQRHQDTTLYHTCSRKYTGACGSHMCM